MLYLYQSYDVSDLAGAMSELIRRFPLAPSQQECVVVGNRSVANWLEHILTLRLEILANTRFPFPRGMVEEVLFGYEQMEGGAPKTAAANWEPDSLCWLILVELWKYRGETWLEQVSGYLGWTSLSGDALPTLGLKEYTFSRTLADLFDRFITYRPKDAQTLAEAPELEDWQDILFRKLELLHGDNHFANRLHHFMAAPNEVLRESLSSLGRVNLFAPNAWPPVYMSFWARVSEFVDVHVFLQRYCSSYLLSDEVLGQRSSMTLSGWKGALASLTQLGEQNIWFAQKFYEEVSKTDNVEVPISDYMPGVVEMPDDGGLLNKARFLVKRWCDEGDVLEPFETHGDQKGGESIEFYSCFGARRELEMAHRRILELFEEIPDLLPHEISVVCSDAKTYLALAMGVFGQGDGDAPGGGSGALGYPKVPFQLVGSSVGGGDDITGFLELVFNLADSRFALSDLALFLENNLVWRHLGLSSGSYRQLLRLFEEFGFTWGLDADHRREHGFSDRGERTLRVAIERMTRSLSDTPLSGVGNGLTLNDDFRSVLGNFLDLFNVLRGFWRDYPNPKSLLTWTDGFSCVLNRAFSEDFLEPNQWRSVREALETVRENSRGWQEPVKGEVFWQSLSAQFDILRRRPYKHGRGVAIGDHSSLHQIPFRVVFMVGLSESLFPKRERLLPYDRMGKSPRPGEPGYKPQGQTLFWDMFYGAKQKLILSHPGNDPKDGSILAPSNLLSKFHQAMVKINGLCGTEVADAHDLPWNEERLFKHSRQVGDVGSIHEEFGQLSSSLSNALNLEKREEEIRIFEFEELQSEQDPPGDILDVELLRFVQDPLKFFLERSLNLRVHREYAKEDRDWDPYQLTGLNRWKWVHRQFAQIGEEIDPTDLNDELHIESFGPFQGLETKRFEHQLSGLRNDNRLPTSLLPRAEEIKWYSRNHDALIRSHITFDNSRTWGVWIQGSGLKPFHTLRAWIHSALLFLSHEERGAWVVGLPDCSESELLQIRDVWSTQGAVDYLDGVFGWYYRGIKCPIVFEAKAGLSAAKKLWKMGIRELSNLESGIPPLSLGSYFLDMDGQLVPAIRQLFGSDFVQEFKLGGRYEYYYADFLRMALLLWGPSLRGSL